MIVTRLGKQVMVVDFSQRNGWCWHLLQALSEFLDPFKKVLPTILFGPEHARTIFAGPIVVLKYLFANSNPMLKGQNGCKKRGTLICRFLIHTCIHAYLDPDARSIPLGRTGMPSDLIGGQALEGFFVIDCKMP
jgi:hypothetical protein